MGSNYLFFTLINALPFADKVVLFLYCREERKQKHAFYEGGRVGRGSGLFFLVQFLSSLEAIQNL